MFAEISRSKHSAIARGRFVKIAAHGSRECIERSITDVTSAYFLDSRYLGIANRGDESPGIVSAAQQRLFFRTRRHPACNSYRAPLCTRVGSERHERNTTSCLLSVYDAALIVNNDKERGKRDSRTRANLIAAAVIRNLPALSRYLQAELRLCRITMSHYCHRRGARRDSESRYRVVQSR